MPNWCYNNLNITLPGATEKQLRMIRDLIATNDSQEFKLWTAVAPIKGIHPPEVFQNYQTVLEKERSMREMRVKNGAWELDFSIAVSWNPFAFNIPVYARSASNPIPVYAQSGSSPMFAYWYPEGKAQVFSRITHWGTKWNANEGYVDIDVDDGVVHVSFDTAWDPPAPWFEALCEILCSTPELHGMRATLYSLEPGMGKLWRFIGTCDEDGCSVTEDEVDYSEPEDLEGLGWEIAEEGGYDDALNDWVEEWEEWKEEQEE